jgi:DASH complex subunit Hsk3 like
LASSSSLKPKHRLQKAPISADKRFVSGRCQLLSCISQRHQGLTLNQGRLRGLAEMNMARLKGEITSETQSRQPWNFAVDQIASAVNINTSTRLSAMPPHRPSSSRLSTATTPAHIKSRQFSHLNSQLAQLQAHLADLDNHIRITAIQAEAIKRLGAQHASMYRALML